MADAGLYTIPVALTFDGVQSQVESQLNKVLDGRRIGQQVSRDLAQGVRASQSDVDRALDGYRQAFEDAARSTQELRDAERRLATERSQTNRDMTRVAELSARVANARRDEERATRRAAAAADDYAQAQQDFADSAGETGSDAGEESGTAFVGGFAGKLKGLAGKGGAIGATLLGLGAVAYGAGSELADQIWAGFDREADRDLIQARLGMSDADIARLGELHGQIYSANFGESPAEVWQALQVGSLQGLIQPEMSDEEIVKFGETFLGVNALIEGDLQQTANTVRTLLGSQLVPDAESALDILTASFQAGLGDDIMDSLSEYAVGWRNAGLTVEQSLALIGQSLDNGVDNSDRGADALRELGRRITEEPEAIIEALDGIGLSGQQMYEALKGGGPEGFSALDAIFDKIRSIEDPVKRNQVAMALLGDTAGDFIGAFTQWDPSAAVDKLEMVDGAASNAVQTAGDNAAGSWESMARTIEVAAGEMQDSLADAFGPSVIEFGNWITDHKDEIAGFMTETAAGALYLGSGMATMAGGTITALGGIGQALGDVVGWAADAWEEILGGFAAVLEAMPEELVPAGWAENLRTAQGYMDGLSNEAHDFGVDTTEFGLSMFDAAESLGQYGNAIHQGGIETVGFQEALGQLRGEIEVLPDGHSFTISDNSPETIERLEELGFAVEQTPTGLTVTASTTEAQNTLDGFISGAEGNPLLITARLDPVAIQESYNQAVAGLSLAGNAGPDDRQNRLVQDPVTGAWVVAPRAFGGIFGYGKLPTDAVIQPATGAGLVQWAEPSTHGEAFIPLNPDRRSRSLAIWSQTGRMLGVPGFAFGGITSGNPDVDTAMSMLGTAYSQANRTDCSGMVARVINGALGLPNEGLMSTKTAEEWLSARGFVSGVGGPGQITVGWYDRGPGTNDGHMAMTLSNGMNAEAGGANGVFTIGENATGGADPQFDQHMYLPNVFGEGPGSTSTSTMTGVSGVGPSGQSGTYTVDQGAVSEAQGRVAEADARVREAEAKQRELEADAKESEVIAAQNAVDSAKRDAAEARTALQEAQRGEFTPNSESSSSNSGSGDMSEVGGIFKSFLTETFGLDGSWLPDIGNLMPLQMADTLLSSFHPEALYQPGAILNPDGSTPLPSGTTSFAPFGLPDTMTALPNGTGPGAVGTAAGGAPIIQQTVDNSQTFNGNVGWDPAQAARQHQRQIKSNRAEPRLPTGF